MWGRLSVYIQSFIDTFSTDLLLQQKKFASWLEFRKKSRVEYKNVGKLVFTTVKISKDLIFWYGYDYDKNLGRIKCCCEACEWAYIADNVLVKVVTMIATIVSDFCFFIRFMFSGLS